jgi:hypothetical protein
MERRTVSIDSENPYATSGTRIENELPQIEELPQFVRIHQIIVAALAGGVITFLLVAAVQMLGNWKALNWNFSFLTILGIVGLALAIPLSILLPQLLVSKIDRATESNQVEALKKRFSTQLVMRCAVVEGPCFLNIVAFMGEHNLASIIAALIGVACIAMQFPTVSSVKDWFARHSFESAGLSRFHPKN